MNKLLPLLFFWMLTGCTTVKVQPDDSIRVEKRQTIVTLTDESEIRGKGFALSNGQLQVMQKSGAVRVPAQDVHRITTIDRKQAFRWGGMAGLMGSSLAMLSAITQVDPGSRALYVLVTPVVLGAYTLAGAGAGYVIGKRTYYTLNPLQPERSTAHGQRLAAQQVQEPVRGFHLGLGAAATQTLLPRSEASFTTLGRQRLGRAFNMNLELGKWLDSRRLWGAQAILGGRFDEDARYSVGRGVFAIGPQFTYFPRGRGLFYKAALHYALYNEDVIEMSGGSPGGSLYQKNYDGLGLAAAVGYTRPLTEHLWASAELAGQGYYLFGTQSLGTAGLRLGLHWY